jgi:hypothetical protein
MELLGTSTAAIRVLLSEDYITTLIDWLDPPLFSWPEHRRISALAATIKRLPDLFAQPSVAALWLPETTISQRLFGSSGKKGERPGRIVRD